MKKTFLLFTVLTFVCTVFAQNYAIGHHSESYIDAARSNRSILTEVYYPADVAGDDVPVANGQFPVIVYGHGFTIAWSNYDYMWQYFVPKGYICVFPRTEGGIFPTPNHQAFGLDLAFLSNLFPNVLNTTTGNAFAGHVAPETCIAGHSMGGGASYLGCTGNTQVTTMVTMSAAETNPLASDAAMNVNIPSMVIVGGNDCVAPTATNSQLFYDKLPTSICKSYINITEGSHCAFASSGATTCYSAEGIQCPSATYIAAQTQRDRTLMLWDPWLRYYLKHECAAWTDFTTNVTNMTAANEITESHNNWVQTLATPLISQNGNSVTCSSSGVSYTWTLNGNPIGGNTANVTPTSSGVVMVTITDANGCTAVSAPLNFTLTAIEMPSGTANIHISPNPFANTFSVAIETPEMADFEISLTDMQGKTLLLSQEKIIDTWAKSYNMCNLASGMYILSVSTKTGKATYKVVKE